jgi:hypothetical protein
MATMDEQLLARANVPHLKVVAFGAGKPPNRFAVIPLKAIAREVLPPIFDRWVKLTTLGQFSPAYLWVAARNDGRLDMLDFGGSLGSSYFSAGTSNLFFVPKPAGRV